MEDNLQVIKGIVVREAKLRESRRLLTILTEEGTRISATARSADRKNSRQSQAACQLLSYSEFTLFSYRDRITVNEAVALEIFPEIQTDIVKLSLATYVCDIAARLSEADFPDNEAFRLMMNTLHALARLDIPLEIIKASFEVRIASIAGYAPDIGRCIACGREISTPLLDISRGEAYCAECGTLHREASEMCFLSYDAALAFKYILMCDLKKIFHYKIGRRDLRALAETAERYIEAQVGQSNLLRFYHNISRNGDYI